MDWKLTATTFGTVFLAELGDKTQLATLTFASSGSSRWAVFLGSAGALVTSAALAVLAGEEISKFISPRTLQRLAGVAFFILGGLMLWNTRGSA